MMGEMPASISRLVGVYDADGTVVGELSYALRARLGGAHCALCDITHGRLRERADWRDRRDRLPVPFVTFHRDDQPAHVRSAAGTPPVVVGETTDGAVVVLADRQDLEACAGSPERLISLIESTMRASGLTWRTAP
jgi:hypothetical protein